MANEQLADQETRQRERVDRQRPARETRHARECTGRSARCGTLGPTAGVALKMKTSSFAGIACAIVLASLAAAQTSKPEAKPKPKPAASAAAKPAATPATTP